MAVTETVWNQQQLIFGWLQSAPKNIKYTWVLLHAERACRIQFRTILSDEVEHRCSCVTCVHTQVSWQASERIYPNCDRRGTIYSMRLGGLFNLCSKSTLAGISEDGCHPKIFVGGWSQACFVAWRKSSLKHKLGKTILWNAHITTWIFIQLQLWRQ